MRRPSKSTSMRFRPNFGTDLRSTQQRASQPGLNVQALATYGLHVAIVPSKKECQTCCDHSLVFESWFYLVRRNTASGYAPLYRQLI